MLGEHEGVWLRGNLHMHTDRSDGNMKYDDAISLYEQDGYDFIAVTDHWVVSEEGKTPGGMLLLSGCEYNVGTRAREVYHIVAAGLKRTPDLVRSQAGLDAQKMIDAIRDAGGAAILAHPSWSLNSADECAKLRGLSGAEIYNSTSDLPHCFRPYSGMFVDLVASQGLLLPCVAADDAHQYDCDMLRNYIMVHSKEKTHDAVMEAILEGDFYATQGPEIHLTVENGVAKVRCSPVQCIVFASDVLHSPKRIVMGDGLTEAEYVLLPDETFIRAEVTDAEGKKAFASPIRIG